MRGRWHDLFMVTQGTLHRSGFALSCFVLVRFFSPSSDIFLQEILPQTQRKIWSAPVRLADAKESFAAWARRGRQKNILLLWRAAGAEKILSLGPAAQTRRKYLPFNAP